MKKIVLAISLLVVSVIGVSQNCPQISAAYITHLSGNDYRLVMVYQGNGTKHLNVSLYKGPVLPLNLLSTQCISTHGNGSTNVDFESPVSPIAVIVPGTGNCNSQGLCDPVIATVGSGGPVPVIIGSFIAKRMNDLVTLNWQTLMEINAKEFTLQRNTGSGFIDLQTIPATAKPTGDSYTSTDKNKHKSTVFYRLRLTDLDGTFSFSESRAVTGILSDNEYVVFPNPAPKNDKVMISNITEPVTVQIIDNMGRIIRTETIRNQNLNISRLGKGNYTLRMVFILSEKVLTRKMLIVD